MGFFEVNALDVACEQTLQKIGSIAGAAAGTDAVLQRFRKMAFEKAYTTSNIVSPIYYVEAHRQLVSMTEPAIGTLERGTGGGNVGSAPLSIASSVAASAMNIVFQDPVKSMAEATETAVRLLMSTGSPPTATRLSGGEHLPVLDVPVASTQVALIELRQRIETRHMQFSHHFYELCRFAEMLLTRPRGTTAMTSQSTALPTCRSSEWIYSNLFRDDLCYFTAKSSPRSAASATSGTAAAAAIDSPLFAAHSRIELWYNEILAALNAEIEHAGEMQPNSNSSFRGASTSPPSGTVTIPRASSYELEVAFAPMSIESTVRSKSPPVRLSTPHSSSRSSSNEQTWRSNLGV